MQRDEIDWIKVATDKYVLSAVAGIILVIVAIVFLLSYAKECSAAKDADKDMTAAKEACSSTVAAAEEKTLLAEKELKSTLETMTTKLTAAEREAKACAADITKTKNQTTALVNSLGNDATTARNDLRACEEELSSYESGETAVIADAARRICCVQRVDNPEIDGFSIVNDRIICEKGGDKKISC